MFTGELGTIISPDYDASPLGMPVPQTGIFDAPNVCLVINTAWIPFLTGVLDRLKWPDVWQGDEAAKNAAFDQIEHLLAALQSGEGCAVSGIEDIRMNADCTAVEVYIDGAWVEKLPAVKLYPPAYLSNIGTDGTNTIFELSTREDCDAYDTTDVTALTVGPPGEPGNPGADGTCVDCGDTSSEAEITDAGAACGIAQYVIPWHEGRFQDMLDILDTSLNLGELVADLMLTWAQVSPITEAVVEAAVNAVTTTAAALRSDVPTTKLEEWQCSLYCAFKDEPTFSKAKFDEWLSAEKAASSALGQTVWLLLMGMYGGQELNRRFIIGALTPSTTCATLCDECPDNCTLNSFAESGGDWTGQDSNVIWSGGAWIADTHATKDNVWISRIVPAGNIVSVKVYATNAGSTSRMYVGKNAIGSVRDTGAKSVYTATLDPALVFNGTTDRLHVALDYIPGASSTHPQRITAVEFCYG